MSSTPTPPNLPAAILAFADAITQTANEMVADAAKPVDPMVPSAVKATRKITQQIGRFEHTMAAITIQYQYHCYRTIGHQFVEMPETHFLTGGLCATARTVCQACHMRYTEHMTLMRTKGPY
jgi:hypothetical protein